MNAIKKRLSACYVALNTTNVTENASGLGIRVAFGPWAVFLLVNAGCAIGLLLLPAVTVTCVVISVGDLVHCRKWAFWGLVLSSLPLAYGLASPYLEFL